MRTCFKCPFYDGFIKRGFCIHRGSVYCQVTPIIRPPKIEPQEKVGSK